MKVSYVIAALASVGIGSAIPQQRDVSVAGGELQRRDLPTINGGYPKTRKLFYLSSEDCTNKRIAYRTDCQVNARYLYSWVEQGMSRYRIAFSGPPTFTPNGPGTTPEESFNDAGAGWWVSANACKCLVLPASLNASVKRMFEQELNKFSLCRSPGQSSSLLQHC